MTYTVTNTLLVLNKYTMTYTVTNTLLVLNKYTMSYTVTNTLLVLNKFHHGTAIWCVLIETLLIPTISVY